MSLGRAGLTGAHVCSRHSAWKRGTQVRGRPALPARSFFDPPTPLCSSDRGRGWLPVSACCCQGAIGAAKGQRGTGDLERQVGQRGGERSEPCPLRHRRPRPFPVCIPPTGTASTLRARPGPARAHVWPRVLPRWALNEAALLPSSGLAGVGTVLARGPLPLKAESPARFATSPVRLRQRRQCRTCLHARVS